MTTSSNSSHEYGWSVPGSDNHSGLGSIPKPAFGRACINCAKAKAKCAGSLDIGGKCERCRRMNKDCQPSPAIRKRKAVKGISKTALLEEKLEGLVELLRSTAQPSQMGVDPQPIATFNVRSAGELSNTDNSYLPNGHLVPPEYTPPFSTTQLQASVPTPPASWTTGVSPPNFTPRPWELTPQEAEAHLEIFRTKFTKHYPFIFIPTTTSAQYIRQSRPFLWHSILTICLKSSPQQHLAATEFRAIIGREAFMEGTKSVDLLQAILVYSAWDQHHCFYKHIMGNLIQLCMAMIYDLGLNKPPLKPSQLVLLEYDDRGCPKPPRSQIRTLDERRALLGCFLLSSLAASYFQKGDALRWTTYSEECCRLLVEANETPDDLMLIQLVRSHLIVEKVFRSPWYDTFADNSNSAKPPIEFYVKAMEGHLQDFKRNIPESLQQNEMMLLEICSVEITIYTIALSKAPNLFSDNQNFQRLEYLYACLRSVKTWFSVFLSLPAADFIGFALHNFRQMAHCIICLYQLSTCEFPDWDTAFVRGSIDLSSTIEAIMELLREVKQAAELDVGVPERIDSFNFLAEKIGRIKTWWDTKAAASTPFNDGGGIPMDFDLNDMWVPELLAPWDPDNCTGTLQYFGFGNVTKS